MEDVKIAKTIAVLPNQKSWLNLEVYRLLKASDAAFRAGVAEALRAARWSLTTGVKKVVNLSSKNTGSFLTTGGVHNALLTHRYLIANTSTTTRFKNPPDDSPLSITPVEVRKTLQKINPCKAAAPSAASGLQLCQQS